MAYKLLAILLLILSFTVNAQKLKKVKQLSKDKLHKEIFTIDKSTKLKHGTYEKYELYSWFLVEYGTYNNGVKHGVWYTYNKNNTHWVDDFEDGIAIAPKLRKLYWQNGLCAEGEFLEGEKVGIWSFFTADGTTMMIYDFDKNLILKAREDLKFVHDSTDFVIDTLIKIGDEGTVPFVIGGSQRMLNEISNTIKFPPSAVNRNLEARVVLSFIVNENGQLTHPRVTESSDKSFNNEALRIYEVVLKNLDWFPGTVNGEFVKVDFKLPLRFNTE